MNPDTEKLAEADKRHLWHPFTQMRDWCAPDHEPLILVEGAGAILRDSRGREYIDGNSSIWTNIHGHAHPVINAAIRAQLDLTAHTSFLGFTNPPAIRLAEKLAGLFPVGTLTRVFFSDDGSTAMEVAIKMAVQYWQQSGQPGRRRFVAFSEAYHGDTMGAASLGGMKLFHGRFADFRFPVTHVGSVEELEGLAAPEEIAAVALEPLIQGAAGMRLWPAGMLRGVRKWCDRHGVLLILDEVMTGFGRTGTMFACEQEQVAPDFIALAKGLTGGYLPLAATLTTGRVFDAFVGEADQTFFYGHSYTGNQIGCAAALASLRIFEEEQTLERLEPKISYMAKLLEQLRASHRHIAEVRQCGFIAGIELKRDGLERFDPGQFIGARVCVAARKYGLLTRPIRDTIVLMPPYCIDHLQIEQAVGALDKAIREVCG